MPSKRAGKGLAGVLVLLWVMGVVSAQSGHTLLGRVSLPNGTTLSQPVKVILTSAGLRLSTFTDTEGRYSFSGLSNSVYELTVEGDNETYETTTVRVEVFTFS